MRKAGWLLVVVIVLVVGFGGGIATYHWFFGLRLPGGREGGSEIVERSNSTPESAKDAGELTSEGKSEKPADANLPPNDGNEVKPHEVKPSEGPAAEKTDPVPPAAPGVDPGNPTGVTALAGTGSNKTPVATKVPWQAVIDSPDAPRKFEDACFSEFDLTRSMTQREALESWFAPLTPNPIRNVAARGRQGQCAAFEGVMRLKSPWRDDTALRLAMDEYNRLQIFFYHGDQGVALVYYEDDNQRWAAYTLIRREGAIVPQSWKLTATDDGRARRTEIRLGGPIEIRYRNSEVRLYRGDILLLSAPLPGPPDEVLFAGKASFHGIELVKSADLPDSAPHPAPFENLDVSGDWLEQLAPEGSSVQRGEGQIVSLSANQGKARSSVAIPLKEAGMREWVVELTRVTPGTGIYFCRGNARPVHIVRFVADRTSGGVAAIVRADDDFREHAYQAMQERPVPFVGERIWLRFVVGCGVIRWWIGSDGVHWADVDEPMVNPPGGPTHFAIQCVAHAPDCQITLGSIRSRRLNGFDIQVRPEVVSRVPETLDVSSAGNWTVGMVESQPADVEFGEWQRACIWKTLGQSPTPDIGWHLVQSLLDDEVVRAMPLDAQLKLHGQVLELFNLRDQPNFMTGIVQRCQELGDRHGSPDGTFSATRRALQSMPFSARHNVPVVAPARVRAEIVERVYARAWADVTRLCRMLRFYHWESQVPLLDWANFQANRALPPARRAGQGAKAAWRHPLTEDVRKEVYNFVVELESALEQRNLADACRLIAQSDPLGTPGLATSRDDEQFVSMVAAIAQAHERFPELRRLMAQNYSELAQLRINQAIRTGDANRVDSVAIQFQGTKSSADAWVWLADRSLAHGWFSTAVREYARAGVVDLAASPPRLRLASAAEGLDQGKPLTEPWQVGTLSVPPADFEKLVADFRQRATNPISQLGSLSRAPLGPPSGLVATARAKLEGLLGESPEHEGARQIAQLKVPWADRQLAASVVGDVAYVSNRFQVAAYDLKTGLRAWQSGRPTEKMLRSQDWALIPMKPLVLPQVVLARQLYGLGPMLVCLDRATGQVKWTAEQRQNEELASDPQWLRGRLFAFVMVRSEQQDGELRLVEFDPLTGFVVRQNSVLRVRDTWWQRRFLMVTPGDDRWFVGFGGGVFCCDLDGQIQWLRKQTLLPPDEETGWVTQTFDAPKLVDQRLFATQPGARVIDCLEAETGLLLWRRVLLELRRVVAIEGGVLVAQTDEGWAGVSCEDGRILWTRKDSGVLDGTYAHGGQWLSVRKEPIDKQASKSRLRFAWSDVATGAEIRYAIAAGIEDPDPRFGLVLPNQNRLFGFFGSGQNVAARDLYELASQGEAATSPPATTSPFWTRHIPENVRDATRQLLPAWALLQGEGGDQTGLLAEAHGEKEVAGVRIRAAAPVVFARRMSVPVGASPRLRLRIGNDPIQTWRVEARWNGKTIWQQEIQETTHPQRWKDLEANLANVAGQSGWLTIRAQLVTGGDGVLTYWKKIEIVL